MKRGLSCPKKNGHKSGRKKGYKRPVCPLVLALYGHPLSGTYWENYYTGILVNKCCFERVPGWECLFFHRQLKVFLSIYVDGFKLAGCAMGLPEALELVRKHGLKLDPPEKFGQYLGVGQTPTKISQAEVDMRLKHVRPLFSAKDAQDEDYIFSDDNKKEVLDEKGCNATQKDSQVAGGGRLRSPDSKTWGM